MKHIKFAVFRTSIIGEIFPAATFEKLLEKLPKRLKEWSDIKFTMDTEDGRKVISIRKDWLDEGMTFDQQVQDSIEHGDHEGEILCLKPRGTGTITL